MKYTVRYWWTVNGKTWSDSTKIRLTLKQARVIAEEMEADGMQTMILPA